MNGLLGSKELYKEIPQSIYVCNNEGGSIVTLNVCNKSNTTCYVSVAISDTVNSPSSSEWIEFLTEIPPNGTLERTALAIGVNKHLIVKSSGDRVNAMCWGVTVGDVNVDVSPITTNVSPVWIDNAVSNPLVTNANESTSFSLLKSDPAGQTYTLSSGTLPTGLSLNTTTAVVSGTSTLSGYTPSGVSSTFQITSSGSSTPQTFYINKVWRDGLSSSKAAKSASDIKSIIGTPTDGVYYYQLSSGIYPLYTNFSTYSNYPMVQVTRLSRNDHYQFRTTGVASEELIITPNNTGPARASKISDIDLNYIINLNTIRWLTIGAYSIFYRMNNNWTSNFGQVDSCSYTTNYYNAFATPSNTPLWNLAFSTYPGACGGGQADGNWLLLSGIHTDQAVYKGGYVGNSPYLGAAIGAYSITDYAGVQGAWNIPGYVFLSW